MDHPTANPQQVPADRRGSGRLPGPPVMISERRRRRALEACERELIQYRALEIRLRDALAESEARLRQKDELIHRQELLKKESDHRLSNDLQMTVSLLSMQSRESTNPEAAVQLAVAANRVAMIERIHHRLDSYEGVQAIEFRKFLAEFGRDFAAMVSSDDRPEQVVVEGIGINLPVATAIPLGFIASELITNAVARAGSSSPCSRIRSMAYALSVSNDGEGLPERFDPGASKGLGMRIIQSFATQIGGGPAEATTEKAHDLPCCSPEAAPMRRADQPGEA